MSEYQVFNPHEKPLDELPIIYGLNNGRFGYYYEGELISEDGTNMGSHLCSDEGYMYGDLGIYKGSRPDRHKGFMKHYPDGYRMNFVREADVSAHEGLIRAFKLNKKMTEEANLTKDKNDRGAKGNQGKLDGEIPAGCCDAVEP